MTRIGVRIALGALTTTVAIVVAGVAFAAPPVGVVAGCATRSSAQFPRAFTSGRNLAVGPLVLVGGGGTPIYSESFGGQKFPLLVLAGHRVTVALSEQTRKGAGLGYGRLPEGQVGVGDAHRVVTFVACPRGQASGSTADGRSVTFWSGGLLARSPRCVPLFVWIDRARSPVRVVVHLGIARCTNTH
jgi:hypothetical protein